MSFPRLEAEGGEYENARGKSIWSPKRREKTKDNNLVWQCTYRTKTRITENTIYAVAQSSASADDDLESHPDDLESHFWIFWKAVREGHAFFNTHDERAW